MRRVKTSVFYGSITVYLYIFTETQRKPPVDLAFALSATSAKSSQTLQLMKDVINNVIEDYGTRDLRYCFIRFGSDASTKFSFTSDSVDPKGLQNIVNIVPPSEQPSSPHVALQEASRAFSSAGVRPNASKVLVVMTDMNGDSLEKEIEAAAEPLRQMKVKIIVIGIGGAVDPDEMVKVTGSNDNVITALVDEDPDSVTKTLMKKVFQPGRKLQAKYFYLRAVT